MENSPTEYSLPTGVVAGRPAHLRRVLEEKGLSVSHFSIPWLYLPYGVSTLLAFLAWKCWHSYSDNRNGAMSEINRFSKENLAVSFKNIEVKIHIIKS